MRQSTRFNHAAEQQVSTASRAEHHIMPLIASLFVLLAALARSSAAQAQHLDQPRSSATLIIFSANPHQLPISNELWPALTNAIHEELASGAPEIQALVGPTNAQNTPADFSNRIQILRGDKIVPGIAVDNPITIFIHGDCLTRSTARPFFRKQLANPGTLGWVELDHGHIGPFAHIECDHLTQLLRPQILGLNPPAVNLLMAFAIARVLLHEWIHIATQSPDHTRHGLGQAEFSAADLIPPALAAQHTGRHHKIAA
jgi:hypothetical protein